MLELCGLEEEIFLQVDKNRRLEPPDFVYVVKYINPVLPAARRVPGTVRACRRTGTESQGPYRMGKWDEYRRDDVECRITEYHWQRGLRQLNRWISLSNGGFYLKRKLL